MHAEYRCDGCGIRNRIPAHVGTRGVRCGSCKHALPTPKILERLHNVKSTLEQLSRRLRPFDRPRNHGEIERVLERQKAILANLPDLPGYRLTSQVCFDLLVDIQELVSGLDRRLANTALRVALRIVREIAAYLKIIVPDALPKLLPRGFGE